jgi:uncharacterized protein YbjT (DUF2867 family)
MSTVKENKQQTILVTGATGKTGSRILQRLNEMKWPVRIGSRSANPTFDWTDKTTWQPALQDIHTVYIAFVPDLAVPGADDIIRAFTKTAVDLGVKKLVLLSGRGEPEAQVCEQIVMQAGVDWSIVRASWFCQNFSEGYLTEPIIGGFVALPVPNIGEPFIDTDDIADVAVVTLTDDRHNGQLYEVTGPRLLSFKQAVEEISKITGKSIHYERVPMKAYAEVLVEHQVPDEYVQLITYLFSKILDGRNASVSDGVERALGRKPTDFADFVRKAAAAGAWKEVVSNK